MDFGGSTWSPLILVQAFWKSATVNLIPKLSKFLLATIPRWGVPSSFNWFNPTCALRMSRPVHKIRRVLLSTSLINTDWLVVPLFANQASNSDDSTRAYTEKTSAFTGSTGDCGCFINENRLDQISATLTLASDQRILRMVFTGELRTSCQVLGSTNSEYTLIWMEVVASVATCPSWGSLRITGFTPNWISQILISAWFPIGSITSITSAFCE